MPDSESERRGATVLLLDGDDRELTELKTLLEGMGHHVRVAGAAKDDALGSPERSELLYTLNHTLLTPLTAIVLRCDMLRGKNPPEPIARGLVAIDRSARAQVAVLDNLLELSRLRGGADELVRTSVDLLPCVRDVLKRNASVALEQNVTFAFNPGPGEWTVQADPVRLRTALHNLVNNAVNASLACGVVAIVLGEAGDGLSLTVTDHGAGFLPEAVAGFFAVPDLGKPGRKAPGGLGLGLPVAEWIVRLHGGSLSASSAGPAKGASFVITLPRR